MQNESAKIKALWMITRSLITASVKFSVIAGVDGRSRLVKRPTLKFTDKEERYLLERRTRVELTPPSSRASLIL